MARLSHFDESGASRMVDVGRKRATRRIARACARVEMKPATLRRLIARGEFTELLELYRLDCLAGNDYFFTFFAILNCIINQIY